jgi:hypothetical protein
MRAIRLRYAPEAGAHDMAKKRKVAKKAAAKAAKKPARKPAAKADTFAGYSADTTVNALVILVVIILVVGATYLYLQKAKAEPALIDVSPVTISIAPK